MSRNIEDDAGEALRLLASIAKSLDKIASSLEALPLVIEGIALEIDRGNCIAKKETV
jgi:hypothetical protein